MRWYLLGRRWDRGLLGVGDRGKNSLFDLLITLDGLVSLGLRELLQFIKVTVDCVGKPGES